MNNKAHLRPKDFDSNGDIIPMACKEEKGDLISREALRKAFHERIYYFDKSSWDEANAIIDNAPTVDLWQMRQEATENALKKAEVLYGRPQDECGKCDYKKFSFAFANGIVEIMSKNGITTVEELLETLKGGVENE